MARQNVQPLSPAQREIMEIVWDRGEISALEVREVLAPSRHVARETVRTLLARMEEKGWIRHRVVGRTFLYSPAIPRDANLGNRVIDIVDNLCGGSADRLMSALLDHRGLTDEEASRIQSMIADSRKRKNAGRRK